MSAFYVLSPGSHGLRGLDGWIGGHPIQGPPVEPSPGSGDACRTCEDFDHGQDAQPIREPPT
jgi:hypothetical protein